MANYQSIHNGSNIDYVISNALLQSTAANTYLTQTNASNTYLTIINADTLYPLKDGTGAYGTWAINISGNAETVSRASFGNSSYCEHNCNNIKSNGLWYYNSNGPSTSIGAASTDGSLYTQAYSTNWVTQIAADYRNGGLFVRGLNNGTWTTWYGIPKMTIESYPALLPTNGSNDWIKIGTSNTSYGLLPSQSGGAGSGHNYLGTSSWYWKYIYVDLIYCTSFTDSGAASISGKATISGGIQSQHGHIFNVAGNEVNFIPDGYNATQWFNYESFGRTNNSTVSGYCMGNGKHGYTPVTASAHNTSSSRLIKENIEDMDDSNIFDILKNIRPVKFDYIDERFGGKNQFGFIAEEIEELIPSIVTDPPNNLPEEFLDPDKIEYKSLDYGKVTPFLVKGWQIQQKEIELLKEEIQQLKEMINSG